MTDEPEIAFSVLDEPTAKSPTYSLPLPEWDAMVSMANHLAKREAEMPFRRRMTEYLKASKHAEVTK